MKVLLAMTLLILSSPLLFANPAQLDEQFDIEERLVPLGHGIDGEEIYVGSVRISPDLMHIGYVSRIGGTFRVWLDGVSSG